MKHASEIRFAEVLTSCTTDVELLGKAVCRGDFNLGGLGCEGEGEDFVVEFLWEGLESAAESGCVAGPPSRARSLL